VTDWKDLESKYFMHTGNRVPLVLVRGEGLRVWDDNGREYLDFVGGWAVTSLGHCHPVLVEALEKQARTLVQVSNQFYSVPQVQLAELLVENSCMDKVFFSNSGAEANEAAVKLARRYGQLKLNGAYEVISTHSSFHGRTLGMVAATGQEKFQKPYEPLPTGFVNVDYNSIDAIKAAATEKTCAVLLEPIQGEGGVNIPDEGYLKAVWQWCDEKGILLILDEIQTGIGRTGSLFAYQQYGVEPDIMTLAKGLGSGVPIGAIMAKDSASVFAPGDHGGTYCGNPLVTAASYAVVKYILDNDICAHVRKMGGYLTEKLRGLQVEHPVITDVRGKGLLIAVQFGSEIGASLLDKCLEKGLLVNRLKPNALRFMPALVVSEEEIDEAVSILDEALFAVEKSSAVTGVIWLL